MPFQDILKRQLDIAFELVRPFEAGSEDCLGEERLEFALGGLSEAF